LFEEFEVDDTVRLDGKVGDVETFVLKYSARIENTLVFSLSRDTAAKTGNERKFSQSSTSIGAKLW
jgi:hypothetical protein